MKRIFKYPTGATIPEGAVYLNTVAQTKEGIQTDDKWEDCWYVWHYFLVTCDEEGKALIN